jgi:hypothetical protein
MPAWFKRDDSLPVDDDDDDTFDDDTFDDVSDEDEGFDASLSCELLSRSLDRVADIAA